MKLCGGHFRNCGIAICNVYCRFVVIDSLFSGSGDWRLSDGERVLSAVLTFDSEICTLPQGRTLSWARSVVVPRSQSCAQRDANRRDLDQRV